MASSREPMAVGVHTAPVPGLEHKSQSAQLRVQTAPGHNGYESTAYASRTHNSADKRVPLLTRPQSDCYLTDPYRTGLCEHVLQRVGSR